jgi:hypothetical protein
VHHDGIQVPSLAPPAVQVILWQDIFAVVDSGRARPHEYAVLRSLITAQAEKYPNGIGCLAIIPRNATPPSDHSREALNLGLEAVRGSLRCMCWLVEGSGFQAAMVRAVLTGLRLVAQRSYATHVSTNMDEALGWMVTHLPNRANGPTDVADARRAITRQRVDVFADALTPAGAGGRDGGVPPRE